MTPEPKSSGGPIATPVSKAPPPADPVVTHQKLFAELFDVCPFPAVVSRVRDHTIIAINKRTSEIFGVAQNEAAGLHVTDYYFDPEERLAVAERVGQDGRVDGFRLRIRHPSGEPFWALFSARLL